MGNPYFHIPMFPTFNVPEVFGKAMAYEGQIHAICQKFKELTDGYNEVLTYVNENFPWSYADPIEWAYSSSYPAHTIVYSEDDGQLFLSLQDVPPFTALSNRDYWIPLVDFNAGDTTYRITDFPGVTNDGQPCTQAIQDAIDSIPAGSTVIFPNGIYAFSTLALKPGCKYDFDNSWLSYSSQTGITCTAPVAGTDTGANYTKNSNNLPGVRTGSWLAVISDPDELFSEYRTYYYRGGVVMLDGTRNMSDTLPFSMTNFTVDLSYQVGVEICNISSIGYTGTDPNSAVDIILERLYDARIHDVNINGARYAHIVLLYCYNPKVYDCSLVNNHSDTSDNAYCVSINSSSHAYVHDCDMLSSWHCVTCGYHEPVLYTTVSRCSFANTGTHGSYASHENEYGLLIDHCSMQCFTVANNATVRDCFISSIAGNAYCSIAPATDADICEFLITGCTFEPSSSGGMHVRVASFPQVSSITCGIKSLVISDCISTGGRTRVVTDDSMDTVIDHLSLVDLSGFSFEFSKTNNIISRLDVIRCDLAHRTRSRSNAAFTTIRDSVIPVSDDFGSALQAVSGCTKIVLDSCDIDTSDLTDSSVKSFFSASYELDVYMSNIKYDYSTITNVYATVNNANVYLNNCKINIYQLGSHLTTCKVYGSNLQADGTERFYTFDGTQTRSGVLTNGVITFS